MVLLWTLWGDPGLWVMSPQFGETTISEVNRAKKVKSDAQIATNKNSDPVQKLLS